jgi:Flp pilus assembly protein TadG
MNNPENPHQNEKGQSLVELAMSMMFLLILVAGVVDLGRAFFTYIALRDAAQEGAAYASVARNDKDSFDNDFCAGIEARAKATSNTQIVSLVDTDVTVLYNGKPCVDGLMDNTDACYGRAVKVIVHYPNFRITTPLLGTIVGSQTVPITASIVDTVLTPPCH